MYIIDTSVAVKWYIEEKDSQEAIKILDDYKLGKFAIAIPDLLIYELANVFRFNSFFKPKEKRELIRSLYDLDLYIVTPYYSLVEKAQEISENYNLTIYDAIFVTLAKEMNCNLITADEKLYAKISDLSFVKLLSEMSL